MSPGSTVVLSVKAEKHSLKSARVRSSISAARSAASSKELSGLRLGGLRLKIRNAFSILPAAVVETLKLPLTVSLTSNPFAVALAETFWLRTPGAGDVARLRNLSYMYFICQLFVPTCFPHGN